VIPRTEGVAGFHVSVKDAAIIDDSSDHFDVVLFRRWQGERPGHGSSGFKMSIAQSTSAPNRSKVQDHVEREAIRWVRARSRAGW
jgi:hypothetical protein